MASSSRANMQHERRNFAANERGGPTTSFPSSPVPLTFLNIHLPKIALALGTVVIFAPGATFHGKMQDPGPKKLQLTDLPAPARQNIEKYRDGGDISQIILEKEEGVDIYEVLITKDQRKFEIMLTQDGGFLETEEMVDASALPPAAHATLQKMMPSVEKLVIERKLVVLYEVSGKVNNKKVSFLLNAGGDAFQKLPHAVAESRPAAKAKDKAAKSEEDGDNDEDQDGENEGKSGDHKKDHKK